MSRSGLTYTLFFLATVQWSIGVAQNLSREEGLDGDDLYVSRAAQLIEAQMAWGTIDRWTDFEFGRLSDVMHDSTGRRVNSDQLRVILAKKKYESMWSSSYDVLAQFLHYPDWSNFKQMIFLTEDLPQSKKKD
jgi:hypothetical protein